MKQRILVIAEKMLSQQLRELQQSRLTAKQTLSHVPKRTEYHLTELGLSAKPILLALRDWGGELQKKSLVDF